MRQAVGWCNRFRRINQGQEILLINALTKLLSLPEEDKRSGGLLFTPREIFQQPATGNKALKNSFGFSRSLANFSGARE